MCIDHLKYKQIQIQGFCLTEVVVALIVLSVICSSVMVVMGRCMDTSYNANLKINAMEIVRENMEQLLISHSVKEQTDHGKSQRYPAIDWETSVETFSPPMGQHMWAKAVCKASYEDASGESKEVELIFWLTKLTDSQTNTLDSLNASVFDTIDAAAEYAQVPTDTIDQWQDDGMRLTEDGRYIKVNVDVFILSDGNPTKEEIGEQVDTVPDLAMDDFDQTEQEDYEDYDETEGLY